METYVLTEGMKILLGIAVGIALGSFYSLISFARCGIGCGAVITAVSDVLFGILSALVVFAFTFIFNSGVLRAYIIFSVILGFSVPLLLTEKLRCRIRRRNKKKGLAAAVLPEDCTPEGIDN